MRTVTLRVDDDVEKFVEEIVRFGLAENKTRAYLMLIECGLEKYREVVERRKRVLKLLEKFLRDGLPYDNLPTHEDVEEGRR